MDKELSFDFVSSLLKYEKGLLFWRIKRGRARKGDVAGAVKRNGYVALQISKKYLLAHRVVWLLCYGNWPDGPLDHIDRNRENNNIENLRACTASENSMNRGPVRGLFKGVTLHKQSGKYQAYLRGKYLGLFTSQEDAARIYDLESKKHSNQFAYLNFGDPL